MRVQQLDIRYQLGNALATAAAVQTVPQAHRTDPDKQFEVERVLAVRRRTANTYQWLIHWLGYVMNGAVRLMSVSLLLHGCPAHWCTCAVCHKYVNDLVAALRLPTRRSPRLLSAYLKSV